MKVVRAKATRTNNFCTETVSYNFHRSLTAHKMKFSIKDFFGKCDQICSFLGIWSHLLKKYLMENFIFCAVNVVAIRTFSRNIFRTLFIGKDS